MDARSPEEILADGQERLARALLDAGRLRGEYLRAVVEVETIRAQVEAATGVSLCEPAPLRPVTWFEDLSWAQLVEVWQRCVRFEEAAAMLAPLAEAEPAKSVGAILKTCPRSVAVQVREGVRESQLFPE